MTTRYEYILVRSTSAIPATTVVILKLQELLGKIRKEESMIIKSKIDIRSKEFMDNAAYMQIFVDNFKEKLEVAMSGGGSVARDKHLQHYF